MSDSNLAIYVHYPFCKSKCPYCDFNSHVSEKVNDDEFLLAYEKELEFFAAKIGTKKVSSIFFGGGTPSLMSVKLLSGILKKINDLFILKDDVEITLEANPTSFERAKFGDFKKVGINRLSLGIQSLNDEDLKFLGREHSASEAIKTIEEVGKIFTNFSFDLIYARPNQSLENWQEELERAINFGTKHLSLYQLTIEKGTRFFSDFTKGKFQMPSEELSAQFYDLTNEITKKNGFENYEISNYALGKKFRSKHNLAYWQGVDYIGIGAGAHSRIYFAGENLRKAIMMVHQPENWLKKVRENKVGIQKITDVTKAELSEELIMMGLRLKEGLDEEILQIHLNKKIDEIIAADFLDKMQNDGFIKLENNHLIISEEKRILTNIIISKICENLIY